MSENTTTPATPETKLTIEQATILLPVFAWLTRGENAKGSGSGRGTASFWSFVGGMRPSIATLVALHQMGQLAGDVTVTEELIEVPEVDTYPSAYVYTQGTGKQAKRLTTLRQFGMYLLAVDADHPLAKTAGVSVSDLTKWVKDVMPDAMDQIKVQREQARQAAERKAAGELMDNTIKDLKAAIEVARNLGLDVTAQTAMLASFEAQQADNAS
jgi:prophage antirepressor-like protein